MARNPSKSLGVTQPVPLMDAAEAGRLAIEKERDRVQSAALRLSARQIGNLNRIAHDEKQPGGARVAASREILAQGMGRPHVRTPEEAAGGTVVNVQIVMHGGGPPQDASFVASEEEARELAERAAGRAIEGSFAREYEIDDE